MALTDKYKSALELAQSLGVEMKNFHEEDGKLIFNGSAPTPYVKNAIWDKFKEVSGGNAADVAANIEVQNSAVYHTHTVASGETLGKIAKHYFDDASKYAAIFEANKSILSDPDKIQVGQELVIPTV